MGSVMVWLLVTLFTSLTTLASAQKGYGPVDLDAVDPLSLSWNQIHWLVRDQIKEVEELKAEHDEIYNEIAGCYGLEGCLSEFDLVDIRPGSKLWNLGLRRVDLSMSELSRQREELEQMRVALHSQMKERHEQLRLEEDRRLADIRTQEEELRRQEESNKLALQESSSRKSSSSSSSSFSSSSSSSSTGWTSSSSSYSHSSGSSSAQGQPFSGQSPWGQQGQRINFFSNQSTVYGPPPEVYDTSYKYSSSNSRSRSYNG